MDKMKIMIVDDDFDDIEFIKAALKENSNEADIMSFSNGIRFIRTFNDLKDADLPELIIIDYNMPVMKGHEVIEKLKEDRRADGIRIVVLSTSASPQTMSACLDRGAHGYYTKPANFNKLVELTREFLDKKVA